MGNEDPGSGEDLLALRLDAAGEVRSGTDARGAYADLPDLDGSVVRVREGCLFGVTQYEWGIVTAITEGGVELEQSFRNLGNDRLSRPTRQEDWWNNPGAPRPIGIELQPWRNSVSVEPSGVFADDVEEVLAAAGWPQLLDWGGACSPTGPWCTVQVALETREAAEDVADAATKLSWAGGPLWPERVQEHIERVEGDPCGRWSMTTWWSVDLRWNRGANEVRNWTPPPWHPLAPLVR